MVVFGAAEAFVPDFAGEGADAGGAEAEALEEGGGGGEGEDGLEAELAGFVEAGLDEDAAEALALGGGVDDEGFDFGEIEPFDVERAGG